MPEVVRLALASTAFFDAERFDAINFGGNFGGNFCAGKDDEAADAAVTAVFGSILRTERAEETTGPKSSPPLPPFCFSSKGRAALSGGSKHDSIAPILGLLLSIVNAHAIN